MIGDIEPEHLFFKSQSLPLIEILFWNDDSGSGNQRAVVIVIGHREKIELTFSLFASARNSVVDDAIEVSEQTLSGIAHGIETTSLDERLKGSLVENADIDAIAEIEEVLEGTVFVALSQHETNKALADVSNCGHAECDCASAIGLVERDEVAYRNVDVRNEDLDAHLSTFVEVDGGFVEIIFDAGEKCSEVFDRIMRLEIGGLIRDEPVSVTVALIERVIGERFDDVEQGRTDFAAVPRGVAAVNELFAFFLNEFANLLATRFAKIVGIGQ